MNRRRGVECVVISLIIVGVVSLCIHIGAEIKSKLETYEKNRYSELELYLDDESIPTGPLEDVSP